MDSFKWIVSAIALSITLSAVSSWGEELIVNPGFESAPIESSWSGISAVVTRTDDAAQSGAYSALVSSRSATYSGATQGFFDRAVKGTNYTVTAWVKLASVPSSAQNVQLTIKQTEGRSVKYVYVDSMPVNHDRWVKLYGHYKLLSTSKATNLALLVSGPAAGLDFYLDNVSVIPPETYSAPVAVDTDFIRVSGANLAVGVDNKTIRLMGVNFVAYDDETGTPEEAVYNNKNYDGADYLRVKDAGLNVVRLNMWYRAFEENSKPYVYKPEGWQWLEQNLLWARQAGVYLILDMHAPQCGYQGPGYTGKFWQTAGATCRSRLKALWKEIALRYKDDPTIAAFDLINEPLSGTNSHWVSFAKELVDTIRTVDTRRVILVEQSFASDSAPFVLTDTNILYDFHTYDPWYSSAQLQYSTGYGDRGMRYPDPEVTVMPWSWDYGALFQNDPVPQGTTGWTWYAGRKFSLEGEAGVFGAMPVFAANKGKGKVWFDDFVIEELDSSDNVTYRFAGIDVEKRPANPFLIETTDPLQSFADYWTGIAISGTAAKKVENSGHRGKAALSLNNPGGTFIWQNPRLAFVIKPGRFYRISGWLRGDGISGASGAMGFRTIKYAAGDAFVPFTKDTLEAMMLNTALQYYVDRGLPVNVGEYGQSAPNFANGRGGLNWVSDMLDLFEKYGVSAQYFNWHSPNWGVFNNLHGFPDEDHVNQPLLDLFKSKPDPVL